MNDWLLVWTGLHWRYGITLERCFGWMSLDGSDSAETVGADGFGDGG